MCDESVTVQRAVDEVVLGSASVCVDVGYLCAELETSDSQRILRWPENTGRLRIRVPPPPRGQTVSAPGIFRAQLCAEYNTGSGVPSNS